jgi:hypothetical protein
MMCVNPECQDRNKGHMAEYFDPSDTFTFGAS